MRKLADIEKAVIVYKFYKQEKSYLNSFKIAFPDKWNKYTKGSLKSAVSTWKNSPEIKEFEKELYKEFKLLAIRTFPELLPNQNEERKGNQEEGNQEETFLNNLVNFQDINEFLAYCEKQANLLTDEKEKQFYLKTLADLLRFKENDKGTEEIQRFYIPLNCCKCPLYMNETKEK